MTRIALLDCEGVVLVKCYLRSMMSTCEKVPNLMMFLRLICAKTQGPGRSVQKSLTNIFDTATCVAPLNSTYCGRRRVVAGADHCRATSSLRSIWRLHRRYYLFSEQSRHASLDAFSLDNNVRQSQRKYTVWPRPDRNLKALSRAHF